MMHKLSRDLKVQMGWQGTIGLLLLVVAGVLHMTLVVPLEGGTSEMRRRIDAAESTAGGQGGEGRDELRRFYQGMPGEKDVNAVMGTIYAAASDSHVTLKEGTFHLEKVEGTVVAYVMDFPMTGKYGAIRMLVSRVLAHNPYMALEQIDFKRDRISDSALRANVRFTLFLRKK